MKKGVWIARDKNGILTIFKNKPILYMDNAWYCKDDYDFDYSTVNKDMFPEVTFENSPKQLIIKED
jgi:hypothetical protein